ncbi:hypothetical protein AmDm5_0937 [Acetobacter malorum]|nr:hypothetical protein AmDm5_0937 [Acetobacter malorum]
MSGLFWHLFLCGTHRSLMKKWETVERISTESRLMFHRCQP